MTPAKRRRHPQNSALLVALQPLRNGPLAGAATPGERERRIAPKKGRHFSLKIARGRITRRSSMCHPTAAECIVDYTDAVAGNSSLGFDADPVVHGGSDSPLAAKYRSVA